MSGAAGVEERDARARRRRARTRRGASVFGVVGEILITAGVITLLYVSWQLWIGDYLIGNQMKSTAQSLSQQWEAAVPTADPSASPTPAPTATSPVTAPPPVLPQPADAERFGIMRIPRFGADYAYEMAGGVSRARTLDTIGIGHYPGTVMPGQIGNFAVAAHRTTYGAPFSALPSLRIGDAIVIETQEGWFTYRFRNLEYVRPEAIEVLLPVPQAPQLAPNGSYITMTTCSPKFSATERAVAFGVFESFTPRSAGAPASLTQGAA
ncbi:class E sortase [Microbacterium sp. CJ88]|uniref:class E sortase n=1 Tax=Microbacterium sp. CJ88 TaxID=3445672 RepID=UPI003F65CC6C